MTLLETKPARLLAWFGVTAAAYQCATPGHPAWVGLIGGFMFYIGIYVTIRILFSHQKMEGGETPK